VVTINTSITKSVNISSRSSVQNHIARSQGVSAWVVS